MKVGDREPFLASMEQREPTIEQHVARDERLVRSHFQHAGAELSDCANAEQRVLSAFMQSSTLVRLAFISAAAIWLASCAAPSTTIGPGNAALRRISGVRTTAYCGNEGGSGVHNATGQRLSGTKTRSAASDWSRFPLGTKFRIVGSDEEYVIDDYGGALVGTNTIDLHKPSRAAVRRWGVRHVDIDVLQWGSSEQSLKVLRPRKGSRIVRRMIAGLATTKR